MRVGYRTKKAQFQFYPEVVRKWRNFERDFSDFRNSIARNSEYQAHRLLMKLAQFREVLETARLPLMKRIEFELQNDRGDVPGWVLVVLMTTGLITGIWTVAAPRLSAILTHSLDSMNNIR